MTTLTRPPLLYHGSKFRIAPWVISYFPPHRVYVESFGGAAGVLLRKPRAKVEIYNDLKQELVNLFVVLRDQTLAARLLELLRLTPYAYDEYRLAMEPSNDPVEAARRTVVRSFMSIGNDAINRPRGGGFRCYSGEGVGSIPAHQWPGIPETLPAVIARLQGVIIDNRDAIQVMRQHDSPQTLFYVDPPYPRSTRAASPGIYQHELSDDDHRALAAALYSLQGMVVISGYPCDLYDQELYLGWRRVERDTYAAYAAKRTEVLWISPKACACAGSVQPMLDLEVP